MHSLNQYEYIVSHTGNKSDAVALMRGHCKNKLDHTSIGKNLWLDVRRVVAERLGLY